MSSMFLNSTKRKTPMGKRLKNTFATHKEALRPKLSKMQWAILKSSECSITENIQSQTTGTY